RGPAGSRGYDASLILLFPQGLCEGVGSLGPGERCSALPALYSSRLHSGDIPAATGQTEVEEEPHLARVGEPVVAPGHGEQVDHRQAPTVLRVEYQPFRRVGEMAGAPGTGSFRAPLINTFQLKPVVELATGQGVPPSGFSGPGVVKGVTGQFRAQQGEHVLEVTCASARGAGVQVCAHEWHELW